jgi:uncharacterized peroxidase-related enzyme
MPFFKSMPDHAGPPNVFNAYPEIYGPWAETSQALMNGPSPLSPGERELIFAYAAGVAGSDFVYVAHAAVAEAWGIEEGLIGKLLENIDTAPVEPKFKPLLAFVRKLTLTPGEMTQADADTVFDAGWDEKALHDAIAITARMSFMQRLTAGHGFIPMTKEKAKERAEARVQKGYVNLYPKFAKG